MKNQYKKFNSEQGSFSPDGDILFDADYTVDGITNTVNLNDRLSALIPGTKITVTKQTGIDWDGSINMRNFVKDSSNETSVIISEIIKFITAVPGSTITVNR